MNLPELQKLIDEADETYYLTGKSIMDDARYDNLKNLLKQLNPTDVRLTRVGAQVRDTIFQKRKHVIPMDSLDKATNENEFIAWQKNNNVPFTDLLHATYKADGGSYSFEYENGRLVYAVSRGNGEEGEDITANALNFRNLPKFVRFDDLPFTGCIRGEVILDNESWEIADSELSTNPRNLAVGIAARKDGFQSHLLQVLAFRIYDKDGDLIGETEDEQIKTLEIMGFKTVPFCIGTAINIWMWYKKVQEERQSIPYWIDGIVVKVNDLELQTSLGSTSHHPRGQIALKFEAERAESVLRGVHLQVGHTGIISPVAEFDPVRLGGATITNATLHNWDYIRNLDLAIGDSIVVIKAGDIIPKIIEAPVKGQNRILIPEPKTCPCCNGTTGVKQNVSGDTSSAIYCFNEECPAKVTGKITRFVKSLEILGIGDGVISTLVVEGFLKDPSDLYTLMLYKGTLNDLCFNGKVKIGEKRVTKLLEEIEKKRELTISEFLGSLGIAGLGKRRVELVQEAMPGEFDSLEDWLENQKLIKFSSQVGLPNVANNLYADLNKLKPLIEKFLKNGVVIKQKKEPVKKAENQLTICITGALSQAKSYFQEKIEALGHVYTNSFSKSVTHLVAADPNSGSTKLQKAIKSGIKVISEEQLLSLLES